MWKKNGMRLAISLLALGMIFAVLPETAGYGTVAVAETTGEGVINASGVNFRVQPDGEVIDKLDRGTTVELLTIPATIDSSHWYKVRYDGKTGYVQAPFVQVTSNGSITPSDGSGVYVKLILSSANLRVSPNGSKQEEWTGTGSTLLVVGNAVQNGGYTWYPVNYNGHTLYVRSDCVQVIDNTVTAAPTATSSSDPTPTPAPTASTGNYAKLKLTSVNLRSAPNGDRKGEWTGKGTTMPLAGKSVQQNGYTWYPIRYTDGQTYYVRGDCVTVVDEGSGSTVTAVPTGSGTYGTVTLVVDNVNLRSKPAGTRIEVLKKGLTLSLTGKGVVSGAYTWYPVTYNGKSGYVRSDCVSYRSGSSGSEVTAAPTESSGNTLTITLTSVNFRKTPNGDKIGTLEKGKIYTITGSSVSKDGYTWYPITVGNVAGYVRGDCVSVSGSSGGSSGSSTASSYVITIVDKVNLRASASKDSTAVDNIAINTMLQFNTSRTVGGSLWYRVLYKNQEVWVLGSCVRVMTNEEVNGGGAAENTPTPASSLGYIRTITGGVNVRKTPAGTEVLGQVGKGQTFSYSKTESKRNYTWYYVSTKYGSGWLRGDCVEKCSSNGESQGEVTPEPSGSGEAIQTTNPNEGKTEATYSILKLGSSGTAVKKLVTALKNKGYYSGSITSSYTSSVESAVKAFQKANGLTADGVAGSDTQHKLYGTVPVGSTSASDMTMAIYPAQKINWFTGGIQELWPKGANVKVYDVKTGIVWWAHRWSGGNHADVEPLTAADSARLCRIYGVSNTQEIADKNLWQRRPCLVTIGTATYACSLYGVPHNYPDGDTIANNDMKGQICIHFTGSKTHAGGQVDSYHTEAIEYAWKNCPNGYK